MKLASWNVNGIRSCSQKGFSEWLTTTVPDILCLQELRAPIEELERIFGPLTQYSKHYALSEKKGQSGVGILSHQRLGPPLSVQTSLDCPDFDREGRTVIVEYPHFILVGAYFPNGQRDHSRVDFKLAFCQAIKKKCLQLIKQKKKELIICGDFNTAHYPIDLKNPAGNKSTSGFLPHERAFLDEFIQAGFVDIFREHHPAEEGHYTWWTYRNDCRSRNIGWRIDYFFVSHGLKKKVSKAYLMPEVLGSDHCPIFIELDQF